MPRRQIALLALLPAFCAPGCCSLARLFCGPDDSDWVQISYRTPREALATFMEAARRDNCEEIYNCLSESLKRRWGNGQAGLLEVCIAWDKLADEYPVHMLGYAEVTELASSESRAAYELDVSGYKFRVDLVQRPIWEVYTDLENAPIISRFEPPLMRPRYGQYVRDKDGERIVLNPLDDDSPSPIGLVLVVPDPESKVGFPVDPRSIRSVRFGSVWKVDDFRPVDDS